MAVREGVPIERLCSLAELVRPDVAELVIEAYWKADGPEPTVYTIDLGWKLLSIARSIGCLDDVAMERLDDMRASLETHRRGGLTEKNMIPAAARTATSILTRTGTSIVSPELTSATWCGSLERVNGADSGDCVSRNSSSARRRGRA